ncbi:hypothetical protein HK099_001179 [Clydaea vesicula]|uniref:Uncharacterized protein n=1 Tax=Clydaea vesicula TaxID=447962 RepID=A0AAD5XZS9_9FUNG|nr:hypothetical protein HK099_001179 [Clydaea vesicula]
MRNSIPTRDQDGNLSIQSANLDPTLHDTDPNYRKYMRDILYGKSKDILYSKINRHLVNDAELFVQSVGNVYISTTKSKFDKKKLSETQPKLNSEGNLKNVNITPNYIKNSHFTLQRSYDENFDRFNSITKLDFPPKKITKHSCISKEKCSKILSDENSLNEKKNSMQQLSYKKFHLNESDINDFKKNLKNFKKGGNIQYSNFNFGSLKMMDEEIIKELKKSEIDLNQGLINGGDAIAEKEKNKKTNSKTYVLNDPCDEFVNEYSSTQRDNFKIGVGECDKANLTVDKESFMKNIRGSHFMFGDGETFLKDSEYDSNFKNLEREEKEKLKNIKKIKEFNSNLLNENFETSNQQSTKSEDYKFKKLIQPITKCDIEKIKNLNSNNSISFGTFQDEDNLKTTSNMEYTNKLNSAFRLNNSFNIPKLKNYNTVKMDDFENISVPTSVNTENFVNYSLDQRKKIYKDNYDNNERTLKFLR